MQLSLKIARLTAAILLSLCAATAGAAFPDKPVTIVVPYPPGGGTDILGRIIGQKLSEAWGQPVVIDNKGGGETLIGTGLIARAKPDGYTIGIVTPTFTINKTLYPKASFDAAKDLIPVAMLGSSPLVLVVTPKVNIKTLQGLVEYSKKNPDATNYSSSSSITLVIGEMFKAKTGIRATHIPYKGSAPSVAAVVAGNVTYTFDTILTTKPLIESGRLVAMGVTSEQQSPALPSVRSIGEEGVKGFEAASWYGIIAPSDTPADVIAKINADVTKVLALPDVIERFKALGATPLPMTPSAFGEIIRGDMRKYGEIIGSAKIPIVN